MIFACQRGSTDDGSHLEHRELDVIAVTLNLGRQQWLYYLVVLHFLKCLYQTN